VTAPSANRATLAALAGLVVAAAALRFPTLDLQSFWVDEGATVRLLRSDLDGLLDGIPETEKTPPLYYVLAWLWTRPFGTGEVGVRSLSALIGVLTVPVAFALGRELVSERAGLLAAALAAVNPLLVWYSQEARAYALLVLLSALATLYCVRASRDEDDRRSLRWWAVCSALALATHYFAIFVVGPLTLWLVARRRRRRPALVASAVIGIAGLALLPLAIEQSENPGSNFITGTALGTRLLQVPKQFLLGYDAPLEVAFTIAASGLAAAGAWLALTRAGDGARAMAALVVAALALPLVAAVLGADFAIARNLIVALVPFLVLLGAGCASAGRTGLVLTAVLAALSLATVIAVFVRPEFQRDDWRGAAEALGPADVDRGLAVNPIAGAVPLSLYLDNVGPFGEQFRPVGEIALVAVASRRPGQTPRPPRSPSPSQPGFALIERVETDTFTLVRLRAMGEQQIASAGLTAIKLGPDLAVTLLQRPER
jgi:mannosyltransferase